MNFNDTEISQIKKMVAKFPLNTEVAVAKITNSHCYFYGATKSDTEIIEINNQDSIFEIGSITKILTSAILTKMAHDGDIDINSPINSFFPVNFLNDQQITFKSLSTHTSGLPRVPKMSKKNLWDVCFNNGNPFKNCTEQSLYSYLQNDLKLNNKRNISYSNLGVGLLAKSLENASGSIYRKLIQDKIFKPLGMQNSSIVKSDLNNKFVQGLTRKGKPISSWDLGYIEGAGAVLSSVSDLTKFVLENFNKDNEFLKKQRELVIKEKRTSMSLGWFILENIVQGEQFYFHNGGTPGFRSAIIMEPKQKNAYIVLSNISAFHWMKSEKVDQLIFKLIKDMYSK